MRTCIEKLKETCKNTFPKAIWELLRKIKKLFLQFIDTFWYAPLHYHKNIQEQMLYDTDYDVSESIRQMKIQNKYVHILPFIKNGMKILDIASGGGEAKEILRELGRGEIDYVGVDHDSNRVNKGNVLKHNIHLLDCQDHKKLGEFIDGIGKVDIIFCIYAFYFFREPEVFLENIHGKSECIILGCYNMGHWSYRLRMLLGRGPVPSPTHYYTTPQTNYAEMQRFWTKKDHEFIFKSLNYRYRLISVKSDFNSVHKEPKRCFLPALFGKSFIYLLEPIKII